jgi:predicted transcriptional regulator YdeE
MNACVLERPAGLVMGITARVKPENADYQDLWQNRFGAKEHEVAGAAIDRGYYGVYYGTGEPGWVDFVAGMAVGAGASAGEGLVIRELPAGRYASFPCTLGSVGKTWGEIYGTWLPASAFVEDKARPCIERFSPESRGAETEVTIFVPIRDK